VTAPEQPGQQPWGSSLGITPSKKEEDLPRDVDLRIHALHWAAVYSAGPDSRNQAYSGYNAERVVETARLFERYLREPSPEAGAL
jgi:hypothetical protein